MLRLLALSVALVAGAATAVVPSLAQTASTPPTITAADFKFEGPDGGPPTVTIAVGGSVQFAYPTGSSRHNVDFWAGGPTSCAQTAGASSGPVPPLPASPTAPGWSGTCEFDSAGTFAFHCDLHPSMTGSVVVNSGSGTTTTTSGTTTTTTPGTTTTTTSPTTTGATQSTGTSTAASTSTPSPVTAGTPARPGSGAGPSGMSRRVSLSVRGGRRGARISFVIVDNHAGDRAVGKLSFGRRVVTRFRVALGSSGHTHVSLALPPWLLRRLHPGHTLRLSLSVLVAGVRRAVVFSVG